MKRHALTVTLALGVSVLLTACPRQETDRSSQPTTPVVTSPSEPDAPAQAPASTAPVSPPAPTAEARPQPEPLETTDTAKNEQAAPDLTDTQTGNTEATKPPVEVERAAQSDVQPAPTLADTTPAAPVEPPAQPQPAPPAVKPTITPPAKPTVQPQQQAAARPAHTPNWPNAVASLPPAENRTLPRATHGQLRGLWVDAFGPGFKTPEQVTKLVADARRMNVNALFVQAGKRGDCYCNNASMPRTDDPEVPAGFDPLQDVITKAHAAGLQVHAWIITTSIVNTADNPSPSQPDHVFNTNGPRATGDANWLTRNRAGVQQAGKDYVLDPGHPAAAAYITEMYASVARNYAVDGVQLDRVRYPDVSGGEPEWGYNEVALRRYRAETGKVGTPAPTDPAWSEWRREQVTNLTRRVYAAVKAERPQAWVSGATIVYGAAPRTPAAFSTTRTYNEVLQDWPRWMREGYLDLAVLMNYKRDGSGEQAQWYDDWNAFALKVRGARSAAAGAAIYLNSQPASVSQARRALDSGLDGWVAYSYRTPDADVNAGTRTTEEALPGLTAALTAPGAPLATPAQFEALDARGLRAVSGLVLGAGEPGGRTVELLSGGRVWSTTRTDGGGHYAFAFTPPGPFEVRVGGADPVRTDPAFGRVTDLPAIVVQ